MKTIESHVLVLFVDKKLNSNKPWVLKGALRQKMDWESKGCPYLWIRRMIRRNKQRIMK